MSPPHILVAGIGNVFLGDDAFGVEVVHRLLQRPPVVGVSVLDFGTRGFDLACAILEGYDAVILVDAVARGGEPGTLYVIEPDVAELASEPREPVVAGHALTPATVLQLVQLLAGVWPEEAPDDNIRLPRLRLVGCEPESLGSLDQPQSGISPSVSQAVERAVPLIQSLIDGFPGVWDG